MIERVLDKLVDLLQIVAGTLLLALFALNVAQIAMRYFAGFAWIWLPDFSRFLFIWLVFIGASVLVARNGHLMMDFFITKLSAASKRHVQVVILLGQIAFFAVMLVWGLRIFRVRLDIPFDTWDFPTGWAYLAVPAAALLMIVFSGHSLLTMLTKTGARVE
jgi:TRAP-type C4-dicarboxylate transport system permease small subunit